LRFAITNGVKMLLIPAIDLRRGKCVRLIQGKVEKETVFSQEPLSIARLWQHCGAKCIHIIDLDGALTGTPRNLDIIYKIVKRVDVPVQLGGGLRSVDIIDEVLDRGVERVIIGTMSMEMDFVETVVKKFKDKIIVGIDTIGGWVAIKGWKETSTRRPIIMAKSLEKMGVKRFLYTNVKRDGTLKGPNLDTIRTIVRSLKVPVLASGGISCLEDIEKLRKLEEYGLEGVVVGKALYTGAVDLKEGIKIAEGKEDKKE